METARQATSSWPCRPMSKDSMLIRALKRITPSAILTNQRLILFLTHFHPPTPTHPRPQRPCPLPLSSPPISVNPTNHFHILGQRLPKVPERDKSTLYKFSKSQCHNVFPTQSHYGALDFREFVPEDTASRHAWSVPTPQYTHGVRSSISTRAPLPHSLPSLPPACGPAEGVEFVGGHNK